MFYVSLTVRDTLTHFLTSRGISWLEWNQRRTSRHQLKQANKERYAYLYSDHSDQEKWHTSFFLLAMQTCDHKLLDKDIKHIYEALTKLRYQKGASYGLYPWPSKGKDEMS